VPDGQVSVYQGLLDLDAVPLVLLERGGVMLGQFADRVDDRLAIRASLEANYL
jgi:hypothetical protein